MSPQSNIPDIISTLQEAKFVLETVKQNRLRWIKAVNSALRDYHHAQQQLALGSLRTGKAIWTLKKYGFGDITRPHTMLQPHTVIHDASGCECLIFSYMNHILMLSISLALQIIDEGGSIGVILD
jgi:hypothetical protein